MRKSEEKMRKVVLITGSSRGIGRAEALRFSADGYAVAVNYIEREDKAEEVVALIRQQGNDAFAYQADVSDFEAVRNMVSKVEKDLGPVEVLVNNAGIARMSQFQDITPELWQRMFAVNLNGAFNTIQAVLPHMLHVHAGVIVNTSSIWGEHGASCEVAYSSTKHAIIGLTKSLAMELAPTGIRVTALLRACRYRYGAGAGERYAANAGEGDSLGTAGKTGGYCCPCGISCLRGSLIYNRAGYYL